MHLTDNHDTTNTQIRHGKNTNSESTNGNQWKQDHRHHHHEGRMSQTSQIQLCAETQRLRLLLTGLITRLGSLDRQLHERNGAEGCGIDFNPTMSQTIVILQNAMCILESQLESQWAASQLNTLNVTSLASPESSPSLGSFTPASPTHVPSPSEVPTD